MSGMSDLEEHEEERGKDRLGRRRKPKRSAVKFDLSPREEGESIEDWIKRETERLVLNSSLCKQKRATIVRKDEARAEAGIQYGQALNEKKRLEAAKKRAIKKLTDEWNATIAQQHRDMMAAKTLRNNRAREHKTMLGKYNTLYNRYFRAVTTRVFQNMKSQCDIKHTWADRKTKRSLQNGDEGQNHKPNERKALSGIESMVKEHIKKAGEE